MSQRTFTPYHFKFCAASDEIRPSFPIAVLFIPPGDLSVFERFFHRLPLSVGVSYLVMEYPGPSGGRGAGAAAESIPSLLERTTLVPVRVPQQGTFLEKDCIYLLPAGSVIDVTGGRLVFQQPTSSGGNNSLLDLFLASVATACQGRCVVILLPDLAARILPGLRGVRDEGGFIVALDEQDFVLSTPPANRSPLVDLFLTGQLAASRLPELTAYFRTEQEHGRTELNDIYPLLSRAKGVDYSRFGQDDILAHLHRRMAVHEMKDTDAYTDLLRSNEEELTRLHEELASVASGFFIDPDLEAALTSDLLPQLLGKQRLAPLRIWMPHCSGGHRAYAIAMVIREYLEEKRSDPTFQLFVTCFNNNAIIRARKGMFTDDEMDGVSRSRRRRFFVRQEKGWQVAKPVRDSCIFATHDLLTDPPFSRIDIVIGACSLFGFGAGDCAKAFRLYHYSLNPRGYLIAGKHHLPAPPAELFLPLQNHRDIYGRKAALVNYWLEAPKPLPAPGSGEREADMLLLSDYVPASFLVDEQFRVVRYYGNTEPYLKTVRDKTSRYLFRIVRDELVFELNDLIELVDREGRAITRKNVWLGDDEQEREVSVEMAPLRSFGANWRLIIIREKIERPGARPPGGETGRGPTAKDLRIQALEKELQEMRGLLLVANDDARNTQDRLQSANEDLQASNEEYQSLNKELKGFNEELSAMHEDLVTRNRELSGLNAGLRSRVRELRAASDAAMAVMETLQRPVVVLRDDLHIYTANHAFFHYFGLSAEQAVGRHLDSVGPEVFHRDSLVDRLRQVQTQRKGIDFEVSHHTHDHGERILLCSASRMAGLRGFRSGLLLSMEDITEQRVADRFRDQMIGIASHELGRAATSIRAYSRLLSNELKESEAPGSTQLVTKLNTQVDRLAILTRDILDVSRIARGRIVLEDDPFDITTLVAETVEDIQEATPVPIRIDRRQPVPSIRGDRERIGRVLTSLLSSAAKYAVTDGKIDIHIVAAKDEIDVSITVSGGQMPVEQMREIFDRTYVPGGPLSIGLPNDSIGLYIASEVVRKHGGSITLNEKGKSAVFSIVLPLEKNKVPVLSVV